MKNLKMQTLICSCIYVFIFVYLDELLILNDEFNNVFEKYDRYMSNRSSGNKASDSQLVDTEEQRFNEQLEAMHITNARHTRQRSNLSKF